MTRKGLSFYDNRNPFIIQPCRTSLNKGVNKKKQDLRSQKIINELHSLLKNQIYKLKKNQHDHSFFSYDNQINHFFKISLLFEIQQFYWKPLFLSNINKNNGQRKKKKNHFFLALDQTKNNEPESSRAGFLKEASLLASGTCHTCHEVLAFLLFLWLAKPIGHCFK